MHSRHFRLGSNALGIARISMVARHVTERFYSILAAMSQFLQMDIFFLVTTIVVIAIGVFLVLILMRIWRILGHVENISKDVSEESALLRDDIDDLREKMRTEGFKIFTLGAFLNKAFKRFTGRSGRRERSGERDA